LLIDREAKVDVANKVKPQHHIQKEANENCVVLNHYVVFQAGATPLLLAARAGHSEVMTMLLEKGASVTEKNKVLFTFIPYNVCLLCADGLMHYFFL
jgi:hypothetical protein